MNGNDDGGFGEESFINHYQAVLQPLRNPSDCWEVDVAQLLDDFLQTVHQVETLGVSFDNSQRSVNFTEAALLLQGSASVYGKKVDNLWLLFLNLLEDMKSSVKKTKRGNSGNRTTNESGENGDEDSDDDDDNDEVSGFLFGRPVVSALDPGCHVKKVSNWRSEMAQVSVKHSPDQKAIRIGGAIVGDPDAAPPPPRLTSHHILQHRLGMVEMRSGAFNFAVNGRKHQLLADMELYSRSRRCRGERIGYKCDMSMNVLDGRQDSGTLIAGYIDDLLLCKRGHDDIILYPESEGSEDDELMAGGHAVMPPEEVDIGDIIGHDMSEVDAGGDDAMDDASEHRVGHTAAAATDTADNNVVLRTRADDSRRRTSLAGMTTNQTSVKRKSKKKEYLATIDPHESVLEKPRVFQELTNKQLERRELRKLGRRKARKRDPQGDAIVTDNFSEQYHKIWYQLPHIYSKKSLKYTPSVDLQHLYYSIQRMWNNMFNKKTSRGGKQKGKRRTWDVIDDECSEDEEEGLAEGGLADDLDDGIDDDDVGGGNNEDGCGDNFQADNPLDIDVNHMLDAQDISRLLNGQLSPSTLSKLGEKGAEYFRKIRDDDLQSLPELDRRVEEWRGRIQPILDLEHTHPAFDIQVYCRRVIKCFPSVGSRIQFSDLVKSCKEYEVNRLFLCVLMLANQLCIEVIRPEPQQWTGDMSLVLLSNELHLDRLGEDLPTH